MTSPRCSGRILLVDPHGFLTDTATKLEKAADLTTASTRTLAGALRIAREVGPCAVVVAAAVEVDRADEVLRVLLSSQALDGLPPALADALRPTSPSGISFTPREREILALLGAGHTNDEIASRLGISPRTVEAHRAHIVTKIGARSRAALISAARDAGLND